jgi:hypothetical protein
LTPVVSRQWLGLARRRAEADEAGELADAVPIDASLLWGECQGSGATPYLVIVSPHDLGYKCTCPQAAGSVSEPK